MPVSVFDAAAAPADEQFDCFYAAVAREVGRMTPSRLAASGPFPARVIARRLGPRAVCRIAAPSHDAARTAADVAADGCDDLQVTLMLSGARGVQPGWRGAEDRVWSAGAGRLFLSPTWRPFRLRGGGAAYQGVKIVLPTDAPFRAKLERVAARPEAAAGHRLAGVTRAACLALARGLGGAPDAEIEALVGVVERLVLAMADDAAERALEDHDAVLRHRVLHEIEAGAGDPDFDLAALAARARVSPRRAQRLLAAQGETFSDLLRAARLERARRAIAGGRRPIQQIAWESGYAELSAFHRAFRRRFGATPGAMRTSG